MRFTITTTLFALFASTVFASPLPIDNSLEGRNAAAVSVERRIELEIPKRQEAGGGMDPDWKRANAALQPPDWKRAASPLS